MILEATEEEQEREELRRMLTTEAPTAAVSPEDEDWVPPWWGTDEQNAKEAEAFANWTRNLKEGK